MYSVLSILKSNDNPWLGGVNRKLSLVANHVLVSDNNAMHEKHMV